MLGPPRGDVGVDGALLHRGEVGVRAIAGVGRDLIGLASHVGFDRVDHRRQLVLIASVGVEAMGDDHLRLGVHRRLLSLSKGRCSVG
jgi:hypothetical protein